MDPRDMMYQTLYRKNEIAREREHIAWLNQATRFRRRQRQETYQRLISWLKSLRRIITIRSFKHEASSGTPASCPERIESPS